jgi:hypothetical protein
MALRSGNWREPGKQFGALLKRYRQQTHDPETGGFLTQDRLAELADGGFSGAMIGHWETGRRLIRHEDRPTLRRLIEVLHTYGGLRTLVEANDLLETGLYSRLTTEEIGDINPDWLVAEAEPHVPRPVLESPVMVILSPRAIYEWFEAIFHWSKADEHARSSWAGMFIWSLAAITERMTAHGWFSFLSALILWLVATWLVAPILRWPLVTMATRLQASILFAVASVVIPLLVALVSDSDAPAGQVKETSQQKRTHFLLKVTGATVGHNTVAIILLFLVLGLFYIGYSPSLWVWRMAVLGPLLMAYVGARRIPADRYKMYAGTLQLHPADPLFLAVFLLVGIGVATLVYFGYDVLSNKAAGISLLIVSAGMALWQRQQQRPIPDPLLIFCIGIVAPFLILGLFLFVLPSEELAAMVRGASYVEIALALAYIISATTIWATVQLRNTPTITLPGAVGLLATLLILLALLRWDLFGGRMATLLVLGLWLIWGRKRWRTYLAVHASIGFLIMAIGLSLFLIVDGRVPVWANLAGYTLVSIGLIIWAYQEVESA